MRWNNLTLDADAGTRLPGYRDPAVVRRFDAPEALETRFYEVRARSVLNRVPEASKVPFRWTINPYRGCSHACTYCLEGDTPVLLADGRTRRIADLRTGDEVLGTVARGGGLRLERTRVLDHWSTVKPAFRVTLSDGTSLVASGDHRFLTDRGWKHVKGATPQRPHLTRSNALVGTGRFAPAPEHDGDFRAGYRTGVAAARAEHGGAVLLEEVVRERVAAFAEPAEVLAAGGGAGTAVARGPRTGGRGSGIGQLVLGDLAPQWPLSPSEAWRKGLLAGVFDVRGSVDGGVLRLAVSGAQLRGWTTSSLRALGFEALVEEPLLDGDDGGAVRLRGGLRERLRFLQLTDPATVRRRALAGAALKASSDLRVVSIEPVGTMRLYDITTGTGDFIADGVVSHNCFARPTHTFLDFDAGRDFEKEIVVKVNAPEVLRVELRRPSWKGEHVAMGTNTDPYQWVEGRYRLMPGIWEALRDARNPCSVLTKSPLVLRDLPLLRQIAEVTSISANLSIPTIDPKGWRATEPHTPNPRARMEAVAELNRNGIPTGVLVAPLMPGINDDPRQVEEILQMASDAGATGVGGIALHLRGEVRQVFMDWLRSERPDLVPRYERLYASGAYAPRAERQRLAGLLRRPGADRFPHRDPAFDEGGHAALRRSGADPEGSGAGDRTSDDRASADRLASSVESGARRQDAERVAEELRRASRGPDAGRGFYVRADDGGAGMRAACHGWRGEAPEDAQTTLF